MPDDLDDIARRIQLVVFDVDGVLTDGRLYYGPDGEALKVFDTRDGHGMVLLRVNGIQMALLSGRDSEAARARARELGIRRVVMAQKDKVPGWERLLAETGVAAEDAAFMGDDVNDLDVLQRAGLAACPADAHPDVKSRVRFVAPSPAGRGAARDLCELILRAKGLWKT